VAAHCDISSDDYSGGIAVGCGAIRGTTSVDPGYLVKDRRALDKLFLIPRLSSTHDSEGICFCTSQKFLYPCTTTM